MQCTEDGGVNLTLMALESWVRVGAGKRGDDVYPPQEPKHLNESGENPDRCRQRDHASEPEDLAEQDGAGDQ